MNDDHAPLPRRATVPATLAGERLDRAIAALFDGVSRGEARRALERGGVSIGGRRVRACARAVKAGDRLTLAPAPPSEQRFPPPSLVYRDEHLLVVDKPAGQLTQPTPLGDAGTLLDAVERLARRGRRRPFVGLVHRLDREASGLVLLALDPETTAALSEALRHHRIERVYEALVRGLPEEDEGLVDLPLAHDRRANRARVDRAHGKPARTRWRVVERAVERGLSRVELRLETGRTHQIRAHMAATLGNLVGDGRYGERPLEAGEPRLFLHAHTLAFSHPRTGERLELEAAVPEAFSARLR